MNDFAFLQVTNLFTENVTLYVVEQQLGMFIYLFIYLFNYLINYIFILLLYWDPYPRIFYVVSSVAFIIYTLLIITTIIILLV